MTASNVNLIALPTTEVKAMPKVIPSRKPKTKAKRDPFVKVEDSELLQLREKLFKSRNWKFVMYPELKGEDAEAVYRKGVLESKEYKGLVPDNLFKNPNDPEIPNKKFGTVSPAVLAVRGTVTTVNGKKRFIAYDAYTVDKNGEPEFFPTINLHLTNVILYGKGFDILPYYLIADANTGNKSEENKTLAELIRSECKKYGWPCTKVSINNTSTRQFILI